MNFFKICFLILFLASFVACSVFKSESMNSEKRDIVVEKALVAENNEDYQTAVKLYTDLLVNDDNGDLDASSYRKKLKDLFFDWSRTLYWKARAEHSVKACEKAVLMLVRARRVYPDATAESKQIEQKMLDCLLELKDNRKSSVIKFKSDIKSDDLKLNLYCRQGNAYLTNESYDLAIEKFRDAMLIDPYYPDAVKGLKESVSGTGKKRDKKNPDNEELVRQEVEKMYLETVEEKRIENNAE